MGDARGRNDLSHVAGRTAETRNRALAAILKGFPDLDFTHQPQYSPFVGHGVSQHGGGTQIGPSSFVSREQLRNTLIHEELHRRWCSRRNFDSHHPRGGSGPSARFYDTVARHKRRRGWQ
ncbi:hypothetical protein [Streptomyces iconiensis]|uniref:hypothetical protein n=1 Tax=Streptomyces iconiensis TaxID=1384038 RepID=UPI003D2F83BD